MTAHARQPGWRQLAQTQFAPEKQPGRSSRGMVVTNHPVASAAGLEMLAIGGNAVDSAVSALFVLTIVEPMMVGLFGGGMAHIRMADGAHVILDGLSQAPMQASPTMYEPLADGGYGYGTVGHRNRIGPMAIATPGSLRGWCDAQARYGRLSLADVLEPAIRVARRGFRVTPYLANCIAEAAPDLLRDHEITKVFFDGQVPRRAGDLIVMNDYGDTLRAIAEGGPDAFYTGALGQQVCQSIQDSGGLMTLGDLAAVRTIDRAPVHGVYRGFDIYGPPPPSAGGIHIVQMLNILEGFDLRGLGFGSADGAHLLAEALKIAFADRKAFTADPEFVAVPTEAIMSGAYAAAKRAELKLDQTSDWQAGPLAGESAHTTNVTVNDADGNIVVSTQTINGLFGARMMIPGTGIIPNNYMCLFDPEPGQALSIAPGKRVTTSMAPTIVCDGHGPRYALGMPGGLRIFGSVMQAIVNLIDHRMSLQEAVEAPRLWTSGEHLELEAGFDAALDGLLEKKGWVIDRVAHVGGGMAAIEFAADGTSIGASCWRADGAPAGLSGGNAREGTRFWPDAPVIGQAGSS
ncbi:gamma-glutamyltransferase [Castellaniella sp.]|uniref:gamma-glutamyltransferase n=1 Tax=Castellaniella sp. TaxID=1955812 RepID=UPI00355FC6B0